MAEELVLKNCVVDLTSGTFKRGDAEGKLTTRERNLLRYLVEHGGRVVPIDELLVEVWGYKESVVTRAPHHTMLRMRNKLEDDPSNPVHLQTEFGVGFRFQPLMSRSTQNSVAGNVRLNESFIVGREAPWAILDGWRDGHDTVALISGPNGVGKTHLAAHWAAQQTAHFSGGVWLVSGEGCEEADDLAHRLSRAMGLVPGDSVWESLALAVGSRGHSLVLVDPMPASLFLAVVERLEEHISDCALLAVTSRIVAQWPQVPTVRLAPLKTRGKDSPAVALFLYHTRTVSPDFSPTEAELDVVASIVSLVEGMPHAIALLAQLTRFLSLDNVLRRLKEAMGPRSGSEMAASLMPGVQEALTAAWEHLDAEEQELLRSLTVFRGGFTFEAMEGLVGSQSPDAMRMLRGLIDRHWVLSKPSASSPRFRLLNLVAVLGVEGAGEQAAQDRQLDWMSGLFGVDTNRDLHDPSHPRTVEQVLEEEENLEVALNTACALKDSKRACAVLAPLVQIAYLKGPLRRGLRSCQRVVNETQPTGPLRGLVRIWQADIALRLSRVDEAIVCVKEAFELLEEEGLVAYAEVRLHAMERPGLSEAELTALVQRLEDLDPVRHMHLYPMACMTLSRSLRESGRLDEALAVLNRGRFALGATSVTRSLTTVDLSEARIHLFSGHHDLVRALLEQALARLPETPTGESIEIKSLQSILLIREGDFEQAERVLLQLVDETGRLGMQHAYMFNQGTLANCYQLQEKFGEALPLRQEVLNRWRTVGEKGGLPFALGNLGALWHALGEHKRAIVFLREAVETGENTGLHRAVATYGASLALAISASGGDGADEMAKALGAVQRCNDTHTAIVVGCSHALYLQNRGDSVEAQTVFALALDKADLNSRQLSLRLKRTATTLGLSWPPPSP